VYAAPVIRTIAEPSTDRTPTAASLGIDDHVRGAGEGIGIGFDSVNEDDRVSVEVPVRIAPPEGPPIS
jgi:hypothetical protein